MTRYAAVMVVLAAAAWAQTGAAKIAGAWHGTLGAGAAHLEIVVHIRRNAGGGLEVTLDSPAQGVRGLQGRGAKLAGNHFSFAVPAVHGAYSGTVAGNRQSIHGTWSQGAPMTLNLTRGAGAAVSAPAPAMLPARPPIPVAQLRPALDAEMQPLFARHTALGLVIGIYENGAERVFAYGAARPESMFEIGSITKSFTGLVLARMVEQHQASLDEPLTGLLPNCWRGPQRGCAARPAYARVGLGALGPSPTLRLAGAAPACFPGGGPPCRISQPFASILPTVQSGATPASGSVPAPASAPIRLVDLATQHSGLPRLPSNLDAQADPGNPYAHYGSKKLLAFLAVHGVARPVQAPFGYSNFGYGLLGWVLARRAGLSYAALVQREITGPLGMSDTVIALTAGQKRRLVQGYSQAGRPVETWDLNALAGAGGLRSTAGDLLKLLRAELHPPQAMAAAVRMTQQLRADGPAPLKVGLGWLYTPASQTYWHDGGTGGYTSFALFRPGEDYAVVVLYNREDIGAPQGPFSDRVAANVSALLAGVPALKLGK